MRDICFRAWDKEEKKMYFQGKIDLQKISHLSDFFAFIANRTEFFEIMQYTCLKDKNGKEIYEGDILRIGDTNDFNVFIAFHDGSFVLESPKDEARIRKWHEENKNVSAFLKFQFESTKYARLAWNTYLPVVGNIYENLELLPSN